MSDTGIQPFSDLFGTEDANFPVDDLSDIGVMSNISPIDLDEIDQTSLSQAEEVVNQLSAYFFDPEYVEKHPYIPVKIKNETDVIRRTMKMLKTNEEAQDRLIEGISLDPTKAALFSALTSLQNAAGTLHKQLSDHIEELESIFQKIEDDTERTFAVKDKEDSDGLVTVRGHKELLRKIKGEI